MKCFFKISAIVVLLFIFSCDKSNYNEAPQLSEKKTFEITLGTLEDTAFSSYNSNIYSNWQTAASKVAVWSNLIEANVKIPYKALNKASTNTPEYFADRTWKWKFEIDVDSVLYEVELFGTYEVDNSILWEMYVGKFDADKKLLLQGYSNKYSTQGNWYFYKHVFQPIDIVKIDWILSDSLLVVNYTNLYNKSLNIGNTMQIKYNQIDTNIVFINFISSLNTEIFVETNPEANFGKIMSYSNFGDSLWHCWNTLLQNIECE